MYKKPTPAEAERLAMLAEECAETVHAVTKILRYGYDDVTPEGSTSRQRLSEEIEDIHAVLAIMEQAKDFEGTKERRMGGLIRRRYEHSLHQLED